MFTASKQSDACVQLLMPAAVLLTLGIGVLAVTMICLWATWQLARQHGRLLLRQDDLERRWADLEARFLTMTGAGDPAPGHFPAQTRHSLLPGERPLTRSRLEREGIKAGARAPAFRLPDIDGHPVSLEDYSGRRVLLVFSDPHCGPCDAIAPELARLYRDLSDPNMALVMVSRGGLEENRRKVEEHGFMFPLVLQQHWTVSKEYGIFATPVAFLIGPDGFTERNVANGSAEVLALAREVLAAKEVTDGQAVR